MTREELIEVMARAICAGQGLDWKDQFSIWSSNGDPSAHEAFKHDAAAALTAIEAAGVRLVPVENLQDMVQCAAFVKQARDLDDYEIRAAQLVRFVENRCNRLLAASPYAPPGG